MSAKVSAEPSARSFSSSAFRRGVLQHALRIAQRPHHQPGVELGGRDQRLLDVVVHGRLLGRDEARAHVDPVRPERERGDERPAVGHASRGDEGDRQLLRRPRQQDEVRHIVFARVAAALEAVDADRIAADRFRLQRMANRRALVDDLDSRLLQHGQPPLRIVARGLDDLHAAVDDRADETRIVGLGDCGKEGEVHRERLVGHLPAAADLIGERLRRALRQAGDDAEPARVRHRGRRAPRSRRSACRPG